MAYADMMKELIDTMSEWQCQRLYNAINVQIGELMRTRGLLDKRLDVLRPKVVWKRDEVGEYTVSEGIVTSVSFLDSKTAEVTLHNGDTGWVEGATAEWIKNNPDAGLYAYIRIYRVGGGWYPDNKAVNVQRCIAAPPSMRREC